MGTTLSSPKDFDFYGHVRSHFLVALSIRATIKNAIKRSIIKQEGKSGEIAISTYFSFVYVKLKTNISVSFNCKA